MKPKITIGHLPILDHLVLGVAQQNEGAYFSHFDLTTKLFPNWEAVTSALQKGNIDGAFLLAPLAMDLFRNGLDIKVALLGHREGQVLVARNEIKTVKDLKGKTIFVPHKYSTHHILLHKILESAEMTLGDVALKIGYDDIKEVADALERNTIQGFIIAEPIGTEAVRRKIGKILTLSQNIQKHHIDCVLVLRNEIIINYPQACQELVTIV